MQRRPTEIPPACHYQSESQAVLWQRVHQRHAPVGEAGYADFYREFFHRSAGHLGHPCELLVTLGAGTGWKEAALGAALAEAGLLRVRAIDADARMLGETEAAFRRQGYRGTFEGVVGDLMTEVLSAGEAGVGVAALGILPNVEAPHFLDSLRRRLRPGDPVWLSANLTSPGREAVLAQYRNLETQEWLEEFFVAQGVRREDFAWDWRIRPLPFGWRVEGWVEFQAPVELRLGQGSFRYDTGERLRAFYSNRMDFQAWDAHVEAAGFKGMIRREGFGDGLWMCRITR